MTIEEAIYRLKNTAWLGTDKDREETEQAVDMAIEALTAGERTEMSEWIVGRKPKKHGRFLVTFDSYVGEHRYVGMLYYGIPHGYKWECWFDSDNEWGDVPCDDEVIIAWKPLPAPYGERAEHE